MAAVWPLQMHSTDKMVLVSLADNANDAGDCWPSISTICERTCLGKTAVIDAIKRLEAAGYLEADRTNGRHTKYRVLVHNQSAIRTGSRYGPVRQTDRTGPPDGPHRSARRTLTVKNRNEPVGVGAREGDAGENPEPPTAVQLSIAARELGIKTQPADPRLLAIASQGVPLDTFEAACQEALDKGNPPVGIGLVAAILTRWAQQADKVSAKGARPPGEGRDVWWTSDADIARKAREVGIPESRWPATYAELKARVFDALKATEAA